MIYLCVCYWPVIGSKFNEASHFVGGPKLKRLFISVLLTIMLSGTVVIADGHNVERFDKGNHAAASASPQIYYRRRHRRRYLIVVRRRHYRRRHLMLRRRPYRRVYVIRSRRRY